VAYIVDVINNIQTRIETNRKRHIKREPCNYLSTHKDTPINKSSHAINSYYWNPTLKAWHTVYSSLSQTQSIKFLTFNVWEGEFRREFRFTQLLQYLNEEKADFVALQAVTPYVSHFIFQNEFIRQNYFISDTLKGEMGSVLLSRVPLQRVVMYTQLPNFFLYVKYRYQIH